MRRSTEAPWSLTKSYHSSGNSSAAMTERFFQTLRKQTTQSKFSIPDNKDRTRSFKLSLTEEPKHLLVKRKTPKVKDSGRYSELSQRFSTVKTERNKNYVEENNVKEMKERFLKVLKKRDLTTTTRVSPEEVELSISGMGVLPRSHKHFSQIHESIIQMMKVPSQELFAINLFIILLGFKNIHLTPPHLSQIIPESRSGCQVIQLSPEQIRQMHTLHQQLNTPPSNPSSNPLIISITLANKQKQQNLFSGKQNFKEIALSLMSKYNIPHKKKKNMERILLSKLQEKKLI